MFKKTPPETGASGGVTVAPFVKANCQQLAFVIASSRTFAFRFCIGTSSITAITGVGSTVAIAFCTGAHAIVANAEAIDAHAIISAHALIAHAYAAVFSASRCCR